MIHKIIQFFARILPNAKRYIEPTHLYKVNLKESPEDFRDELFMILDTGEAPNSSSVKEYAPDIKNQGSIGSCGSHAFCTALEIIQRKKDKIFWAELSEQFHYYRVREEDYMNTLPKDSGQYLRDGAKVCNKVGISPEKLCSYDIRTFNNKPTSFAYSFAKFFKVKEYSRCYSVNAIKEAISQGYPVVFGIRIQDSIYRTNNIGDITGQGKDLGGHALCAVSYDDLRSNPDGTKGSIEFANSWGTRWGARGYGFISYELLRKNFIEAWAIKA